MAEGVLGPGSARSQLHDAAIRPRPSVSHPAPYLPPRFTIICGFDALTQLVRPAAYLFTGSFHSLPMAAATAMHLRTQTLNCTGDEGFQALENLTTVRWFLLAFGALPQAAKLAGMGGVQWTKARVGLYIASFVIMEAMIICAGQDNTPQYGLTCIDPLENDDGETTLHTFRRTRTAWWQQSALEKVRRIWIGWKACVVSLLRSVR